MDGYDFTKLLQTSSFMFSEAKSFNIFFIVRQVWVGIFIRLFLFSLYFPTW